MQITPFGRHDIMSDRLSVYLQDHLAGSVLAVELVEFLQDQHANQPLGVFASIMLKKIKSDQDVLRSIARKIGDQGSEVKEAAAWLSEKVARLKLGAHGKSTLGRLEALEFLALGIQGKLALWRALNEVARWDERFRGIRF